ncbi:YggS family pyridoxal phosphate-dependent enzyme [Testudinibacter sp. TR-2022]|uniref:YggS family pyridoxal phosphate-dependent enzyme n=1 Tax=Testudinibacter sp. TR-2022 TaxID=2585029 RepID=UPI001119129C|nr:YggS family pyridoxal phosphate-dependent enzyme [Testudinibacter sp. TR-2022]TNH03522.1 YggS family pyridoxal phosphate-dependent enzyme [Pasteurellaceae bacterium Phil31]TNH07906.1 YggS family pyridoxal phosphate-dependent enzyme [Testudinibacter sp. TR-2022]TNH10357.1 YggS family pyridoxal phosphate-dependent enzyme [Testudinibacter sp. TR-2022]TNH13242.1 YggS family pyridoxal phosphate-dependent enzyme [Testudinibacter sp. TR-2022]TNH20842.1 YggS family pyridoxal phosphate-dependent enz
MSIQQNLAEIHQQITHDCQQADRTLGSVKLLAVSKTKPFSAIAEAVAAGQTAFGENYVQEGVEKIQYFQSQRVQLEWHFIGPLQSNKSRLVAEHFDWIETVDRLKIAERLSQQRPTALAPLNVLIQINISDETTKSGIMPHNLLPLATQIAALPNLRLRGLMAIPQDSDDLSVQQQAFSRMQQLFQQLQLALPEQQIDTLSLGMSGDMAMAIKCGSTQVRIGTAIFGARS